MDGFLLQQFKWNFTPEVRICKNFSEKHKTKDKYHKCETTVQIKMMHEERNKYAQETYYI